MLAESEVGARREANKRRMRSPAINLRAGGRFGAEIRSVDALCLWQGGVVGKA